MQVKQEVTYNDTSYSYANDVLYGAEYEVGGYVSLLDWVIYTIKISLVLYADVEKSILFS